MLQRLKISNYALIPETEAHFGKGLTVITGETGAGKSILLGALSLVLGNRADNSVIRQGCKKAVVEADFEISNYNLQQFFVDNDLDYSDITNLRREITDTGKSRAFVNDTPVTVNTLKELGQLLTEIHSQHQTSEIGDETFQLNLIDSYAQNQELLDNYAKKYSEYQQTTSQLEKLLKEAKESAKESEYLHFRYDELHNAALHEGEQKELEDELEILSHNEDIKNAVDLACNQLSRDDDNTILQKIRSASSALNKISGYFPKAAELASRLENSYIELDDIARDLTEIDDTTEYSPERIEFVNERLSLIYNLEKKFNVKTVEELVEIHNQLYQKLLLVDNFDAETDELKKKVTILKSELSQLANQLTKSRKNAVLKLRTEITQQLETLAIKDSEFDVNFVESKEFRADGRDNVKFMFSANKNVPLSDLSKTASGGELSRLMLVLKHILSQNTKLPTIIFDEIDTGVSGDVADKMGTMFRRIAENMQVICITHLPQVAAKGNNHLKVFKHEENGEILSSIKPLNNEERMREIAGMLSGEIITGAAMMNAADLLNKND